MVGADPRGLRGRAALFAGGQGGGAVSATSWPPSGTTPVLVDEVDASEAAAARTAAGQRPAPTGHQRGPAAAALAHAGCWSPSAWWPPRRRRRPDADGAPTEEELLARRDRPPGDRQRRGVGAGGPAGPCGVRPTSPPASQVTDRRRRGLSRPQPASLRRPRRRAGGWRAARPRRAARRRASAIAEHLLAAARRREFRGWLDARRAELVQLAPGYEHPGDPRQPDNTHRH